MVLCLSNSSQPVQPLPQCLRNRLDPPPPASSHLTSRMSASLGPDAYQQLIELIGDLVPEGDVAGRVFVLAQALLVRAGQDVQHKAASVQSGLC